MSGALLSTEAAARALSHADRRVYAHSYGWLTAVHPDPDGRRLQELLAFFRGLRSRGQLPAGSGLFWDCAPASRRDAHHRDAREPPRCRTAPVPALRTSCWLV